ncbi:hypothetical protein [Ureaplasma canigenitalium]|uniref:hypothetical protein n=1 Tax=Ureaplasma canigenitalium TaxID=42092 RepID=UPI000A5E1811|nr:hypothetical protein [Ureaplasma canigenitalium]
MAKLIKIGHSYIDLANARTISVLPEDIDTYYEIGGEEAYKESDLGSELYINYADFESTVILFDLKKDQLQSLVESFLSSDDKILDLSKEFLDVHYSEDDEMSYDESEECCGKDDCCSDHESACCSEDKDCCSDHESTCCSDNKDCCSDQHKDTCYSDNNMECCNEEHSHEHTHTHDHSHEHPHGDHSHDNFIMGEHSHEHEHTHEHEHDHMHGHDEHNHKH